VALAAEFETLRVECAERLGFGGKGVPIPIISAYRTVEHNGDVGGAGRSQHAEGRALDIAPPHGLSVEELGEVCLKMASERGIIRGVGIYVADGHVHFDIRPETALATWRG
jgi:uncharacterized protein YcbK (DUF882 family)